jgi:hypothetical protein
MGKFREAETASDGDDFGEHFSIRDIGRTDRFLIIEDGDGRGDIVGVRLGSEAIPIRAIDLVRAVNAIKAWRT